MEGISTAAALPEDLERNIYNIGTGAMQEALALIAHSLTALGYPVEGALDPHETNRIQDQFAGYVRALALNHAEVRRLNDPASPAEVRGLEACAPEGLLQDGIPDGISSLEIISPQEGRQYWASVNIKGTRGALIEFLLTNWSSGDPEADAENLIPYVKTLPLPEAIERGMQSA